MIDNGGIEWDLVDDGSGEYSNIKSIRFDSGNAGFEVYPNPTSGGLHLRPLSPPNGPVSLLITDSAGRVLLSQNIDFQQDESVFIEKEQLMGAGFYFLKITEKGTAGWQEKLLVTDY